MSRRTFFGPISLTLTKGTGYLVYAAGSVANNTFTLLVKTYEAAHPYHNEEMVQSSLSRRRGLTLINERAGDWQ